MILLRASSAVLDRLHGADQHSVADLKGLGDTLREGLILNALTDLDARCHCSCVSTLLRDHCPHVPQMAGDVSAVRGFSLKLLEDLTIKLALCLRDRKLSLLELENLFANVLAV